MKNRILRSLHKAGIGFLIGLVFVIVFGVVSVLWTVIFGESIAWLAPVAGVAVCFGLLEFFADPPASELDRDQVEHFS